MTRQRCNIVGLLTLLLLTTVSVAGVKVNVDKNYPPNKKIVLKAAFDSGDKAAYLWDVGNLSDDQYEKVGNTLYVWAGEGTYTVMVTAIDFDAKKVDQLRVTFTVGKLPPTPVPVDPPTPGPVDPQDELLKSCKEAFSKETDTFKTVQAKTLAAVYREASKSTVNDKRLLTTGDLVGTVHDTVKGYLPDTALPLLRKGPLQDLMKKTLSIDPKTPLTDELRKTYKDTFTKISSVLEALTVQSSTKTQRRSE